MMTMMVHGHRLRVEVSSRHTRPSHAPLIPVKRYQALSEDPGCVVSFVGSIACTGVTTSQRKSSAITVNTSLLLAIPIRSQRISRVHMRRYKPAKSGNSITDRRPRHSGIRHCLAHGLASLRLPTVAAPQHRAQALPPPFWDRYYGIALCSEGPADRGQAPGLLGQVGRASPPFSTSSFS